MEEKKSTSVETSENNEKKVVKKTKKKKDKKPNFFVKLWKKIKDVFSELKKVTWPTFGKILKQTGIVLVVVLIFLVVITAFDFGLYELLKLISPKG